MKIFNTIIPILMHFFMFSSLKAYSSAFKTGIFNKVKASVSQLEGTFLNDGLVAIICWIYCHKLLMLSNQMSRFLPENFNSVCLYQKMTHKLTLLHSERPKLYGVLAILSAIGLTHIFSHSLWIIFSYTVQHTRPDSTSYKFTCLI